jgi:hypothetical protein
MLLSLARVFYKQQFATCFAGAWCVTEDNSKALHGCTSGRRRAKLISTIPKRASAGKQHSRPSTNCIKHPKHQAPATPSSQKSLVTHRRTGIQANHTKHHKQDGRHSIHRQARTATSQERYKEPRTLCELCLLCCLPQFNEVPR